MNHGLFISTLISVIQILIPQPDFKVKPLFNRDTVSICIAGDVMMHQAQIENTAIYGYEDCLKEVEDRFKNADLAIANMEFTLAGRPYTGYPSFSAPDSYASYLARCGIDIFLTANNHIHDKGAYGAERTLKVYDSLGVVHGIRHTGSARTAEEMSGNFPLIVTIKGIRIAIINVTYGTNSSFAAEYPKAYRLKHRTDIANAVAAAKQERADIVIAFPHWGEEYQLRHSAAQRETAEWLASLGVDAIVGAHPHVVQDYEELDIGGKTVPVIYSLGNLISNMSAENTRIGMIATIRVTRDYNGDIKVERPELEYTWCTLPGRKCNTHSTVPVKDNIGKKDRWRSEYDYELMISTWKNVMRETGR